MKKLAILIFAMVLGALFYNFTWHQAERNYLLSDDITALEMPDNVKAILDNSCAGCHNSESGNIKAKTKLNLDKFGTDYSNIKSAAKLKDIADVVKEGEMPPKKFLSKYPEKALSEADQKVLMDWAMAQSDKLIAE